MEPVTVRAWQIKPGDSVVLAGMLFKVTHRALRGAKKVALSTAYHVFVYDNETEVEIVPC